MITASNKMASGRNLLWRPIQGGRGSHENQCSQKSFVLSRGFLESYQQAAESLSVDLPCRLDLACEIPLYSGDRLGVRSEEHRWPSSIHDGLFEEKSKTSERKPAPDSRNVYRKKRAPDPRRYSLPEKRKEDRGAWYSPRGRRLHPGTLRCHEHSQDRNSTFLLGNPGISSQGNLQIWNLQEQNPTGHRNPDRGHPNLAGQTYGLDGCLVYLRSYSQSYYSGRMDVSGRDQAKPSCGDPRKENFSSSPGQGTEKIQNDPCSQKEMLSRDQTPGSAAKNRNCSSVYFQIQEGRCPVLYHQQPHDDRSTNGRTLPPAGLDRDFPPRHQAAPRIWRGLYAFLGRSPNTLDPCRDRLQLDRLVEREQIQEFSSDDSPF